MFKRSDQTTWIRLRRFEARQIGKPIQCKCLELKSDWLSRAWKLFYLILIGHLNCESIASALKNSVNSRKNTWMKRRALWFSDFFLLDFRIFCDHSCGLHVYYGFRELLYDKRTSQRTNSSFSMVRISFTTVTPRLQGWRCAKFVISCYSGRPTRGLSFCQRERSVLNVDPSSLGSILWACKYPFSHTTNTGQEFSTTFYSSPGYESTLFMS